MSDAIRAAIEVDRAQRGGALIPFVTAGYPELESLPELLKALDQAGATVIEVGIPFSDSLADGPTVQDSYHQAVSHGMDLKCALAQLKEVLPEISAPVLLMGSLNPIHRFGWKKFLKAAEKAGVEGLLIPDFSPEMGPKLRAEARDHGLAGIPLLGPNTPPERLELLLENAGGFIYQISRLGTTGARSQGLPPELAATIQRVRNTSDLPLAVGFGISSRDQVQEAFGVADGAVVGSALLKEIARAKAARSASKRAQDFVRALWP